MTIARTATAQSLATQGSEKPPDFIVNLPLVSYRLGNFIAQQLAASLSQAMNGNPRSPFSHTQFGCHLAVRNSAWFGG